MTATIQIDTGPVVAEVMRIRADASPDLASKQFISLRIGDLTVLLNGFDAEGAARAREIANELAAAADRIAEPPVVIVPPLVLAGE